MCRLLIHCLLTHPAKYKLFKNLDLTHQTVLLKMSTLVSWPLTQWPHESESASRRTAVWALRCPALRLQRHIPTLNYVIGELSGQGSCALQTIKKRRLTQLDDCRIRRGCILAYQCPSLWDLWQPENRILQLWASMLPPRVNVSERPLATMGCMLARWGCRLARQLARLQVHVEGTMSGQFLPARLTHVGC